MAAALQFVIAMRWDKDYRSPNVDDRRSSSPLGIGGGGGLPLGALLAVAGRFGWKGILIAVLVVGAMTYGGVCNGSGMSCLGGGSPAVHNEPSKTPANDEQGNFIGFVFDDVQKTWRESLKSYKTTKLVLFRNQVQSACGTASSAVGPFYCPVDHQVYIDLTFYDQLRERFGAPGDFAQAYVIAHEVGHHVQNLNGLLGKGEVHQIETELQADCLAGAWAQSAEKRGLLEVGDIDEALNAASQIGDDTIQRKTQGHVQPETWTHGSAAQRSSAFKKGYTSGANVCL
jgi:predicted metalloprotease